MIGGTNNNKWKHKNIYQRILSFEILTLTNLSRDTLYSEKDEAEEGENDGLKAKPNYIISINLDENDFLVDMFSVKI